MVVMLLSRQYKKTLKMPTENPTATLEHLKRKIQTLLTDIGGEYYFNKIRILNLQQSSHK